MRHLFNKYSGHCPIPTYREDLAKRSPKYVLKGVVYYITDSITPGQHSRGRKLGTSIFKMPGCHDPLKSTGKEHRCHPVLLTPVFLLTEATDVTFYPHLV